MARYRRHNIPRSFNAAPSRTFRPLVGRKPIVRGRQLVNFRAKTAGRASGARPSSHSIGRLQHPETAAKCLASDPLFAEAGIGQPVQLSTAAEPYRNLPSTMAKLAAGEQLRVVVLGDSIVNDTFQMRGPGWGAIGKHYGSRITVIKSVRGDSGAWWYSKENRVQEWVLDHKPDLVMIGGISNFDDIESMRSLVEQIRAARPDTEIVLMSAGANLGAVPADPQLQIDSSENSWRAKLLRLSNEAGTGFIDFEGSYRHFVYAAHQVTAEVDHKFFQRDKSHTNRRGELLLGAILSTFFIGSPSTDATRLSAADLAHSITLWTARRCKALLRGQLSLPQPNTIPAPC